MAALTADRNTLQMGNKTAPDLINLGIKASTKVFKGGIACMDTTSGFLVPGSAATTLVAYGIFLRTLDNSAGANAALNVDVRQGVFKLNNSAGADAIAAANAGSDCYIVDDNTVALTDGLGTRSFAGKVVQIDSDGVWVQIGLYQQPKVSAGNPVGVIAIEVDLTSLTNALALSVTPRFAGRIMKISLSTSKAAAGAGATATLTPAINAVNITGGVLTPTLANQTVGAELAATAITALNTFAAGQAITITASAVTAFTADNGTIFLHLG